MGFIKAFAGAIGGTLADQWKDFYGPMQGVPATAALFPAVPQGTNAGRGSNTKGSDNIISNGSKIIVPEGTVFVLGDNRANSGDSRRFGCVPYEKIEGKVVFRFWPISEFGAID